MLVGGKGEGSSPPDVDELLWGVDDVFDHQSCYIFYYLVTNDFYIKLLKITEYLNMLKYV